MHLSRKETPAAPTPLPPPASLMSLPGPSVPRLLSNPAKQLDTLLDTHQWIHTRTRTLPDDDFERAVTVPD